ncbi:MobF family relaxase [Nocardioides lianchengensis]|uniref:Conjugative relaxase domain-containing protein, TrwC/TraI family n=1 Tax=Nocardioides lianchengensis TaxID=1045774 RepID=A0A1G6XB57_9ACTN|nr:MobF family relaxase [Nocardioides lianchengensis]SDD75449.1 conjugative relaxase domain-containing protein, TrwC/TraI family [Nocardioides lianchengensis]
MHGGIKVYRGSAKAARNYVEADRPRADDYYLAEGTGLAEHHVAIATANGPSVATGTPLDGDAYEAWVAGLDRTGRPKGRLRTDDQGVRFVEVVVNGPKTWSLAAAVHPEIAAAYEAAQDRAAGEIIGWLAENATTRVGPRGRQVQVPVERIEAATIRHYTSRAGDPHRHLHLQINARVWAAGRWRGIHTVGVRDSLDAINGIGHAAVQCDPDFRHTLQRLGYTLDASSGEIRELVPFVGEFSERAAQIDRNVAGYEAEWRTTHPGEEPGPRLRQAWDTRAWAQARPDKVVPEDGVDLARRWVEELHDLGFHSPTPPEPPERLPVDAASSVGSRLGSRVGVLDREEVVETVLSRLGARRSAWNAADIRGQVEQAIAAVGIVTDPRGRVELAEDLTARAIEACVPLLNRTDVPGHVRALTSPRVLAVEADLTTRLAGRAATAARPAAPTSAAVGEQSLDHMQRAVVAALAGGGELVVIEGAAGAGKTTTLAAARTALADRGNRLIVVTPTLKASQVAARELKTPAFSAAWLAHQYGFRWDEDGRWTRDTNPHGPTTPMVTPTTQAVLSPGDVLLVDEAGMLDQDTANALMQVVDETGARVAFMGDRHQLPAVGRGGVLDHATRWANPGACVTLDAVHRFADDEYAQLSLLMRSGERSGEVFDRLHARGQIHLHATDVEQTHALAELAADGPRGRSGEGRLLVADTRVQVDLLNKMIRDRRVAAGQVDDTDAVLTGNGGRLGVGDWVMTRLNDRDLDVANRETWTITRVTGDGAVALAGDRGERVLPGDYARRHLAHAYATTAYGAQGETVTEAHLAVSDSTDTASAYVAMTRGRHANTAHLVADNLDDARRKWIEVFSRDRADLGPAHAANIAVEDIDRYGPAATARTPDATGQLQAALLRQRHEQTGATPTTGPRQRVAPDPRRSRRGR